jgi:hypothetical protein
MAAVVVATAACSTPAEPTRSPAPLSHTFASPDDLARAVLAALERNDQEALRSLALSEGEFRDHVWPELPASRPERNVPFAYVWDQLHQRSTGDLASTLARYGGKRIRFVRTTFTGETTQYQSFVVMRDSEVIATDENGHDLILRLYGSAMVKDGRYKLFSYVVDD